MKALVTGAAGFIGSHLAERLLTDGHTVIGIDAFTEYYSRRLKERNIAGLRDRPDFTLVEADVADAPLQGLLGDCDAVFHHAAQPGVRTSWGDDFRTYIDRNVWVTHRLLEAAREASVQTFVFASSSSVYGNAESTSTKETDSLQPISPYGVTKLAAEQLCFAYARSYGVPVVALRYFTVYGPRQRPDMAFSRFIEAMLEGWEVVVYGDGKQTRDFTYVSDAVDATVRAAYSGASDQVFNVGGGSRVSVLDVLTLLGDVLGMSPRLQRQPSQRGDARDTAADLSKTASVLGYRPAISLRKGLKRQIAYMRELSLTPSHLGVLAT